MMAQRAPRSQSTVAVVGDTLVVFGAFVHEKLVGMLVVPWPMRTKAESEPTCNVRVSSTVKECAPLSVPAAWEAP